MKDDGEADEDWGVTFDNEESEYWEDYLGGPEDEYFESEARAYFEERRTDISDQNVDRHTVSREGHSNPASKDSKVVKSPPGEESPNELIPLECYYDEFNITDVELNNLYATPRFSTWAKKKIPKNAKMENLDLGEMQDKLLRYTETDEWDYIENEVDEDELRKQVLAKVTGCSVSDIYVDNNPLKDIFTIDIGDVGIDYIVKGIETVRDYQREDLAERKAEARLRIELLDKSFEDYMNYYRQEFTISFRAKIRTDESDWTIRQYILAEALNSRKFYRELYDTLREKRELQLVAARIALQEYGSIDNFIDATVVMKPASKYLENGKLVAFDSDYFIFKLDWRW